MEQEIKFLNMETIYSKKKDEYFYIIRYLLGEDVRQDFVPKEVYEKIKDKKPVHLKSYIGHLLINRNNIALSDIEEMPIKK